MSTKFPGGIDDNTSLPNPGSTDNTLNSNSLLQHHYQHDTENDALKAIETKLGTTASTPGGSNQILISTSNGSSSWGNLPVGGDLTGSLPNPALASTGVGAGTYGSSTQIPVFTVDGKGRLTSVSNVNVVGGGGGGASPLTTKGDIWVYSTADTRLPVGGDGQILQADSTQGSGLKWVAAPTSAVWGSITGTLSNQTDLQTALNAKAAKGANSDITSLTGLTTPLSVAQGGTGSSSTAVAANNFFASPNGSAGSPVFRAIVAADIPTLNQNTTGSAATLTTGRTFQTNLASTATATFNGSANVTPGVTGILGVANGGTGASLAATGGTSQVLKQTSSGGVVTVGQLAASDLSNGTTGSGTVVLSAGPAITGHPTIEGVTSTGATGTGKFVFDTSPVITSGTVAANPIANLGIASKQYVDALGTGTLVQNEIPGGLVNGSNTAYTTASTFATGSLRVYLNGQRLTAGSGVDYVEGTQAFTMQYAPATGDVLMVDYNVNNSTFIQGSNSIIVQETPTGTVNGSTTLFTTLQSKYVANSLEVFINGIQQTKTTDYTETSPGSGTFTFATAPLTGDIVKVSYQFSTGASGNADTVDGFHANSTPTASTIPVLDSSAYMLASAIRISDQTTTTSVTTQQTTTSTTFADLATVGPSASVSIGPSGKALVFIRASFIGNSGNYSLMGVAVSGASTVAANDNDGITQNATEVETTLSAMLLFTGLTAGSNTFTAKYRVTGGTGTWQKRNIIVIPL